ncbi:hypothetical protein BJV78DRAFT_1177586 [Lactifluus subvellereus]|nr:hypothetical protein BJV78DRAFT_1177586 [Lactifluus subvellereus]
MIRDRKPGRHDPEEGRACVHRFAENKDKKRARAWQVQNQTLPLILRSHSLHLSQSEWCRNAYGNR